ncbi:MAG: queuosine precursor transporter [Rhodocyclaceae bacterium]|nr:queuosine precursor transporter [Rhodocyclaceae bacterium]
MNTVRQYRYYSTVTLAFVVVFLCSNLIGPAKGAQLDLPLLGTVTFGAGVIFFPISFIFGDILTEVYGYAAARRVIWSGFAAMVFASAMAALIVALPPAPWWPHQHAYEVAFGNAWRVVAASLVAYCCGEFVNSYILARLKVLTQGRYLWFRTIGSTLFGEAVDSSIFYPLAFWNAGIFPNEQIPHIMLMQFLVKTGVEVLATPLTYWVVGTLKRAEREDWYDRDTDFNPFRLDPAGVGASAQRGGSGGR